MTVLETLKGIIDGTEGGFYIGGTLDSNGFMMNFDGWNSLGEKEVGPKTEYIPEEKYRWCKVYVENKTENHHYYSDSKKYIETYESNL